MSNQTYANSTTLYTKTLPITTLVQTTTGTVALAFSYSYQISGNTVTIKLPTTTANATSTSPILTFLGPLPAEIRPSQITVLPTVMFVNNALVPAVMALTTGGGLSITSQTTPTIGQPAGIAGTTISYSLI